MSETLFFSIFLAFIILMLTLDLGVFHKKNHVIGFKEATIWTVVWIAISLLFYLLVLFHAEWIHGIDSMEGLFSYKEKYRHGMSLSHSLSYAENLTIFRKALSLDYLTGYLVEKSLSLDNIFVMLVIFTSFKVDPKYYHKVLFWGILGAIVFRFIFIFLSATLIHNFKFVLLIFGVFLIFTGIKMFFEKKSKSMDIEKNPIVRFLAKLKLTAPHYQDGKFFVRENGRLLLTPLFVVLIIVEFSDIIFAVDSIPAIFSITFDPFIVFFSNIFAILGLRSLFFVLQNIVDKFRFLKVGLACLLTYIGVKMSLPFIHESWHIPTSVSLIVILSILTFSILLSILIPKKTKTID